MCLSGLRRAVFLIPLLAAAFWQAGVRVHEQHFDWTTADQDQAHFEWSAAVINETTKPYEVQIVLELLDDDDNVIHRDDMTITLQPAQQRNVQHEGALDFDAAVAVVSYRFRREVEPPPEN